MTFCKNDIGAGCLYVALLSGLENVEVLNILIQTPLCEIIG